MRYLSVCSGIEAATVAWHPLGWEPAAFSEIEKFPRQVLAHHYPNVPLHGDFTTIEGDEYGPVELLVGGTPCQSFSIAGLRKGLADPRGNLMLEYGALAERLGARWLVWENVPGVLSSNGGRDFGTFLGMLAELGYGFAYRVFDSRYFGSPQGRRRVFVVGCRGDYRSAGSVLFEKEDVGMDAQYGRKAWHENADRDTAIAFKIRGGKPGGGKGYLGRAGGAFTCATSVDQWLFINGKIRKFTPVEYERLQGFPDGYTDIMPDGNPTPDGPRYKALGNSMAVPVMAWIGKRLQAVEDFHKARAEEIAA